MLEEEIMSEYVTDAELEQETEYWSKLFASSFSAVPVEKEVETGHLHEYDKPIEDVINDRNRLMDTIVSQELPPGYAYTLAYELAEWEVSNFEKRFDYSFPEGSIRSVAEVYANELFKIEEEY